MTDELYERAVSLVRDSGKPSAAFVCRRLGIDYAEAHRLMARMEAAGLVSPMNVVGRRLWLGSFDAKVVSLAEYRLKRSCERP